MLETLQKTPCCWVNTARNRFCVRDGVRVALVLLWPNCFLLCCLFNNCVCFCGVPDKIKTTT